MAESLAVRHRPRRFADVAGQRHVSAVLRSAAALQTPPQQILLTGGSGLGKTTLARIFAAALFCAARSDDGDACGTCESCTDVTGAGGYHPDVIELDAASNGGKDEIREIAARASLAPLRAPWKVYIIDEAHGLSSAGEKAFLKLLEEPPGHALFVLATTDPDKLDAPVRGRCSTFEVLPPTREEMSANLTRIAAAEGWDLPARACDAVLDATDPALGMRGTVMTLEKLVGPLTRHGAATDVDLENLLGAISPARLAALTDAILDGDRPGALLATAELAARVGGSHLRRQLTAWARAELLAACRSRRGADAAYHRYELLATAGTYPGALEVAIARMSGPGLDTSALAAATLLEQAEELLAQARALRDTPPDPNASPQAASPAPVPAEAGRIAPSPTPDATLPSPTSSAPATGARALTSPLANPTFVAVLNAVGKESARAASVLRRCEVALSEDGQLQVRVPADLSDRATEVDLRTVLERARTGGTTPLPVELAGEATPRTTEAT